MGAEIRLARPSVRFDEVEGAIRTILETGRLTDGPVVREFERGLAARVGVAHAVATTSATTALHLSLVGCGIESGDEVLVADFSFPATGHAVMQLGATPVLVDSGDGWSMSLEEAAARISPRTRALIVVDVFGVPADLEGAAALAREHGLVLIEDAACAIGSMVGQRSCGSWPSVGCFSFHPRKVLTTGEGGAVTTDDGDLAARLRALRSHGAGPSTVGTTFDAAGFNYRMAEIPAALGAAQLERLDDIVDARNDLLDLYRARLADVARAELPMPPAPVRWNVQSLVVLLDDDIDRDLVIAAMAVNGVETTLGTYALHAQRSFEAHGYRAGDLPRSLRNQRQSLTLPLWEGMDDAIVDRVVGALERALLCQR